MNGKTNDLRTPLKRARGLGSAKDGTHHFIWQRVTAIATGLSGLWLLGMLLTLRSGDYAVVHGLVADPINARCWSRSCSACSGMHASACR